MEAQIRYLSGLPSEESYAGLSEEDFRIAYDSISWAIAFIHACVAGH